MNYRIYQLKFQNSLFAAALEGCLKRSVAGLGWCRDGTNDTLIRHEHCRPRPTLYSPARPSPSQQPATLFFYQDPCPQCPQSGLASGHWRSCRIFFGFQGHVLFWGESMAENKRAIAMSTYISLSDLFIPLFSKNMIWWKRETNKISSTV